MSYPINYPTPQGANVQIFRKSNGAPSGGQTWIKPLGASFVWFTLIGAGGSGDNGAATGGGSGAVTNFMGPAFLIPDSLQVDVGSGGAGGSGQAGADTSIWYAQKDTTNPYLLIRARGGQGTSGGSATASNYFSAMGFYQSIAGQAGSASSITPSSTTFLSGGTGSSNLVTANYGYVIPSAGAADGFFQMQPIIVGTGGSFTGKGGIGCGGGSNGADAGGDGLVVIITW